MTLADEREAHRALLLHHLRLLRNNAVQQAEMLAQVVESIRRQVAILDEAVETFEVER